MDDDQQFCLRWNNHQSTLISVFDTLLENETLVDCTLAAEGKFLKAHKVVLSACSPYFATLLQEQYDKHPIFILKDVKYQELRAMMDYMYRGEVNISQDQLAALLKAAESLQIKGLSDNRTAAGGSGNTVPKIDSTSHQAQQQQQQQHRNLNVPLVGKISGGYTLEQTKRQRLGPSSIDAATELSGSREGSSSPSRRRRKVRRRSIENVMSDVHHDNSNSSQQQQQSNSIVGSTTAGLSGVSAITAAASALAAAQLPAGALAAAAAVAAAAATGNSSNVAPGSNITAATTSTASVTKKTEANLKSGLTTATGAGNSSSTDAMNTDNLTAASGGTIMSADEQDQHHINKVDKQQQQQQHHHNNKQQKVTAGVKDTTDMVVEPKSEYDDEGNEETVEDLTLDDEMGMDDLDHNAGTSQGGADGSNQGYVPWQHDRSQDELLLATQEAQQRDPQDLRMSLHNFAIGVNDISGTTTTTRTSTITTTITTTTPPSPASASTTGSFEIFRKREITATHDIELNTSNFDLNEFCEQPELSIRTIYNKSPITKATTTSTSTPVTSTTIHIPMNTTIIAATGPTSPSISTSKTITINELNPSTNNINNNNNNKNNSTSNSSNIICTTHKHSNICNNKNNNNNNNIRNDCNDCQITAAAAAASFQLANLIGNSILLPQNAVAAAAMQNVAAAQLAAVAYSGNKKTSHSNSNSNKINNNSNNNAVATSLRSNAGSSKSLTLENNSINSHHLKKTNSIQFNCEFCAFSCSWKYDLKLHLRQKHGIHNKKFHI